MQLPMSSYPKGKAAVQSSYQKQSQPIMGRTQQNNNWVQDYLNNYNDCEPVRGEGDNVILYVQRRSQSSLSSGSHNFSSTGLL